MEELNLPSYSFKFREDAKKTQIFDQTRKKYYILTPEEWVRQNIIEYLVREKGCLRSHIAVEQSLKLNTMNKRADVIVYNNFMQPALLVECKAPEIKITQKAFDQIGRYNMVFKVPYLMVTNGLTHYCAQINFNLNQIDFLREIPHYEKY